MSLECLLKDINSDIGVVYLRGFAVHLMPFIMFALILIAWGILLIF